MKANNVYVGNRYVPVFADPVNWDNIREYEPLTIVTYQGASYTSRKTVPAGIDISNTDYWALTGNYNAQVEQYRQQTSDVANSLASEIATRASADYMIKGGDLLCIGDSYLKGSNHTGTPIKSWGDYLADYMGKSLNTDYYKYFYGGCGFVTTVDGNNFLTLLHEAYEDISDANKVGTIVVLGGVNDQNNGTVASAITSFIQTAKTLFPNAVVYYTFGSTFLDSPVSFITNGLEQYGRSVGNNGGVYIGNIAKHMSGYKMYDSDGQHPSEAGQKHIAEVIYGALHGSGVPEVNRGNRTLDSGTYLYNYVSSDTYVLGSYHRWDFNNLSVADFTADGLHLGQTFEITSDDLMMGKLSNEYYHTQAPAFVRIRKSNDVERYYMGTVDIKLTGNHLEFYPFCINDDYSNYGNGTLIRLMVEPFELKIPVSLI